MIRFYAPDIESSLQLPEVESQHCIRVLRHRAGDVVEVVDGRGNLFTCRLVDEHSKHTSLEIVSSTALPCLWPGSITIAVAPTKLMDRMEWLVEKLVEIGVNRIVPLLCERSERKEIKVDRLNRIAVSAMKQSLKAVLPVIDPMTPLKDFLAQCSADDVNCVAHCDRDSERRLLSTTVKAAGHINIMIGPEGDFSPAEINSFLSHGFVPVSLGEQRLRTETAALVACDTVHIVNQINGLEL